MATKRIPAEQGEAALADYLKEPRAVLDDLPRLAVAVRYSLQLLQHIAPGRSVEVRVPPWGAVQIIEGPQHGRGTPPAVVEARPEIWLDLVTGRLDYETALKQGQISASGLRTDLQGLLPLRGLG